MERDITICAMDGFCVLPAGHSGQHSGTRGQSVSSTAIPPGTCLIHGPYLGSVCPKCSTAVTVHERRRAERMKYPEFREAYQAERARLGVRRAPTHNLRIDVPLDLDANAVAEEWDIQGALAEAVKLVLSVARVGTLGLLCDDPTVTLDISDGGEHEHQGEPFEDEPSTDDMRYRHAAEHGGWHPHNKAVNPFELEDLCDADD